MGPIRWAARRAVASGRVPTLPEVRDALGRHNGPRAHRLEVFAVEDTTLQVTWGALGPGPVRISAADSDVQVMTDGGPGSAVLADLPTSRALEVTVAGDGVPDGVARLTARTLTPPPGEELYRFATISDLHVGATTFGYLHTISDNDLDDPHPERCARAARREAVAWGAARLIVKGDVVDQSHPGSWVRAVDALAGAPVPIDILPGNHETKRRRTVEPEVALAPHGFDLVRGVQHLDVPGLRLLFVDSTRAGDDRGRLGHLRADIVARATTAPGAVLVAIHHHPARVAVPVGWPLGIPHDDATETLDALAAANPAAFVTTGHVHRNRRWAHGPVVITSVGSVKDYPGVWAGYVVHEGGVRQVVRRVAAPAAIRWTERTGDALLGAYRVWTPGGLSDRCFSWTWPRRPR